MVNYVRTGPFTNNALPAVNKTFLDKLENVLQQPSGGSETGKYILAGPVYASGAVVSQNINTFSHTAVPTGVTIDTADLAPTGGMSSDTTNFLSSSGFQVYSLSTSGPNLNARAAGNWTVNY